MWNKILVYWTAIIFANATTTRFLNQQIQLLAFFSSFLQYVKRLTGEFLIN